MKILQRIFKPKLTGLAKAEADMIEALSHQRPENIKMHTVKPQNSEKVMREPDGALTALGLQNMAIIATKHGKI